MLSIHNQIIGISYLHFFYNQAAESEILGLKEIIGYEKEKNLKLETQLNAFRAACTCCGGGNEKTNIEDCSLVDLDHRHNLDQEVEYCTHIFMFSCLKVIDDSVDAT